MRDRQRREKTTTILEENRWRIGAQRVNSGEVPRCGASDAPAVLLKDYIFRDAPALLSR
jgi:hypothetical protein